MTVHSILQSLPTYYLKGLRVNENEHTDEHVDEHTDEHDDEHVDEHADEHADEHNISNK